MTLTGSECPESENARRATSHQFQQFPYFHHLLYPFFLAWVGSALWLLWPLVPGPCADPDEFQTQIPVFVTETYAGGSLKLNLGSLPHSSGGFPGERERCALL